jgi:O-antigen ligase
LILALPTYLIRFQIGPIPSTLLEIIWGSIFLVWLVRFARQDFVKIRDCIKNNRWFFIFLVLFVIGSLLGVSVSDLLLLSIGQWRAYFLEPILFFFVLIGRSASVAPTKATKDFAHITADYLVRCLILSSLSVAVYSIFQWITGWGIATPEWTAAATRRVTAFFTSPNSVGLYLEGLLVLTWGYFFFLREKYIPLIQAGTLPAAEVKYCKYQLIALPLIAFCSISAIVFTKSDGTVLALGAAALVALWLCGYRKIVGGLVLVAVLVTLFVPKIHSVVMFQDKSGQNRLTLWGYTENYLTQSPKNFVFGAGVRQFFRKIQKPHYDVKKMERLIYPHNIVFNFWSETGLLGLVGFLGMFGCLVWRAWCIRKISPLWGVVLLSILVAIFVHGLVDVPYFKNDLAMLFWILAVLFFQPTLSVVLLKEE